MAEGLFRHLFKDRKDIRVLSAGVGAGNGQPPSPLSVRVMNELGLDISQQRSLALTGELVDEADFIFGMTRGHVEAVISVFPRAADKTFVLREFDDSVEPFEKDVADPIGGNYEIYLECRKEIEKGVESIARHLSQAAAGFATKPALAVGADHGGVELKDLITSRLRESGVEVQDFGTNSTDSADYPDFALAVSRSVANGNHDLGLLICKSGVGMSMTANKLPGIRAALAVNAEMAAVARKHNDANVLCLGSIHTSPDEALAAVEAFMAAEFEGGRHERRIKKMEAANLHGFNHSLSSIDPEIAQVIADEKRRQQENIELIASENFTSPAVIEATGSVLTNKYAEGYPAKRWYGGCEFVDTAETLAIERAKELFGAEHANVQPHCGSSTNMAVYFAFLKPGDKILTMDLSHGGHLTHGNKANFSGHFFEVVHYGVRADNELIDYDQLAEVARKEKPAMITVGASAYPRVIDFARMGEIAKEVGALLLADIAHIAGLVAAGVHPSPVPHADFVTTTTHKTLRGPRGGLILCKGDYAKKIDSQVFPGIQGGPLMHVIAAKAVCFKEALQPEFKEYQQQIVKNAAALAEGLKKNNFRLISGGTDNHLMLVDVGARDVTGKQCQHALDEAGITVNKNTIPFETRSPFQASGIRIGTPAVTTRGMKEAEMAAIADMISEVLLDTNNLDAIKKVRERVRELTAKFPLPY